MARGWYVGERKALTFRKIKFGVEDLETTHKVLLPSAFVQVKAVYRRKNGLPSYGKLLCSHYQEITWQHVPCTREKCILFKVVQIAKRIVLDLLKIAQRNTRIVKQPGKEPGKDLKKKSVESF